MLKPLHDKILVKQKEVKEEKLASGLVLPSNAQEKPQEGEVVAVGQGRYNDYQDSWIPLIVEVGDRVFYSKYGGTTIGVDGEDYLVLTERDILAVEK